MSQISKDIKRHQSYYKAPNFVSQAKKDAFSSKIRNSASPEHSKLHIGYYIVETDGKRVRDDVECCDGNGRKNYSYINKCYNIIKNKAIAKRISYCLTNGYASLIIRMYSAETNWMRGGAAMMRMMCMKTTMCMCADDRASIGIPFVYACM